MHEGDLIMEVQQLLDQPLLSYHLTELKKLDTSKNLAVLPGS
jgi:hypothetical protein